MRTEFWLDLGIDIKMDLKDIGLEDVDFIHLSLVNTVMNLRIP
jgi:hypothetical protein